ncbi:MAG TPA: LLM class flavin-dependent oxidoreductase [Xanthobacteraceae bacterium]|nr:LLM class flavin-dependent oxidoreductase [Xanthobacteraceae bacterium]
MRISIASMGDDPGPRYLENAKLAEILGFDGFFHNDKKWARDVFVRLGAATQATSRIKLGTSVIDPYTRHAALLAQATATLAELAPGRIRAIMGSGSHFETLPGYGNPKPVAGLREASELMHRLWRGEKVTIDGEIVKFKDGSLDWKPTSIPELYIASRGPQILKLAGEIAEGVLIGSFATPPGIEYAKRHIAPGLQAAGRDWKDIRLCSWVYLSVLDRETDPVPEGVNRGVSFAFWSSRKVMTEMADELAPDITDEFRKFLRDTPHEWSPNIMAELRRLVPRGLIDSLALVGTAEQIVRRLRALEAVGIEEIVAWPFPAPGQNVADLMVRLAKDVLPHVSGRKQAS